MFVRLNQDELNVAVMDYLASKQGIPLDNKTVDIRFIAVRKPPSTIAEVDIQAVEITASDRATAAPEEDLDFDFPGA